MLRLALLFLLVAVIAALFGFGAIESTAIGIAQVLFFIFIVLFVAFFIADWMWRPRHGPPAI